MKLFEMYGYLEDLIDIAPLSLSFLWRTTLICKCICMVDICIEYPMECEHRSNEVHFRIDIDEKTEEISRGIKGDRVKFVQLEEYECVLIDWIDLLNFHAL